MLRLGRGQSRFLVLGMDPHVLAVSPKTNHNAFTGVHFAPKYWCNGGSRLQAWKTFWPGPIYFKIGPDKQKRRQHLFVFDVVLCFPSLDACKCATCEVPYAAAIVFLPFIRNALYMNMCFKASAGGTAVLTRASASAWPNAAIMRRGVRWANCVSLNRNGYFVVTVLSFGCSLTPQLPLTVNSTVNSQLTLS